MRMELKDSQINNGDIINNDPSKLYVGCSSSSFNNAIVEHTTDDERLYSNGRYDDWRYDNAGNILQYRDAPFMNGVC